MDSALDLTARLESLSSAALRSGAAVPAIAKLLESASVAALNALALEALYERPRPVAVAAPATPQRLTVARLLDAA